MSRRGVRVLPDDEHPHVVERRVEGAQHVVAGREVAAPGGRLGAEEVAERGDARRDGRERPRPARVDEPVGGEFVEELRRPQAPIVETSTPCSAGSTRQTLPLPSTRRPPSPTISAVRSSMPSPPPTSPDSTAATRRESMPRSATCTSMATSTRPMPASISSSTRRLFRVLRCDDHAADARAAPERALGRDHRAGRDAEVGHPAGDEPTQLAEHRLESGAHLFDEAAAHGDAVDVGDRGEPDRLARSPCGQLHLDLVAAAGRDQEIGERRRLLLGLGVQGDHGDARPRATCGAAAQYGLGDERRVQRGIRAGGRAAADEMHAHAAPSLTTTGGSDDHGNTIQSSVLRKSKSGTSTVCDFV